ncbi:KilA-N domain-containing protein [Comamonas sp. 26]|uniref:KilA-N domain-containing protein n=1 Tax=Comamonas sp. 26 TaxID=2035201 RepID=UPI0018ED69CB|nr:KilA-N domain-containing protein [Comamonas sp. 26]
MSNSTALSVAGTKVRLADDLYSLNDLHKAAGGEAKHQPALFMRLEQTQALIHEIGNSTDLQSFKTKEGRNGGTYACKELVIAYAAWISAAFQLKVIRVFLDAVQPAAPAIDYTRLNPTQKQDLREIVQAIVDAGIQKHGETWARFQKKFRVNKYEELPASRYEEARSYLISKLPMGYEGQVVETTSTLELSDPKRMELAFATACEASALVQRTVFNAMMQGDAEEWQHSRYLLNLNYDSQGRPTLPHAQPIATDQMVVSFNSLPQRIADGEIIGATDAQLATLATACTQRLTQRAQHREKQVTLPLYPSNPPGKRPASAPSLSAKQPPAPDEGTLRMLFR